MSENHSDLLVIPFSAGPRELLGQLSNFPTRDLPPPGATPRNINIIDRLEYKYKVGDKVLGRHFEAKMKQWSSWFTGEVVKQEKMFSIIGSFAKVYCVRHRCPIEGIEKISYLRPYLYEIWPWHVPFPTADRDGCVLVIKCLKNWTQLRCVYAPIPYNIHGSSTTSTVMVYSEVMEWKSEDSRRGKSSFLVRVLQGREKGKEHTVSRILPYTQGTFEACKRNHILILAPDGKIE